MDLPLLLAALRTQGDLLAETTARRDLTAAVPTCPGWSVRDLLLHVGGVHRWAATIVGERRTGPIALDQPYDIAGSLPDDEELRDWYGAGLAELERTLAAAPADVACWSFLPAPSPLACWVRRQAHETAIHRVDADRAEPAAPGAAMAQDFAEDGVDELLTCFVSGRNRRLRGRPTQTWLVHATDVDSRWLLTIGQDLPHAERVGLGEAADVRVAGPARDLYLALWNRAPWDGLATSGETPQRLAEQWASGVHVRWS